MTTEITCQCGETYRNDAAGRFDHKRQQGHAPAPKRERLSGEWAAAVRRVERGRR
jgi:hypothetical protein